MDRRRSFSLAFSQQAGRDFDTFSRLCQSADTPYCHGLHFLQMACEKLSKAYLTGPKGVSLPDEVEKSHGYIGRNLPILIRQLVGRSNSPGRAKLDRKLLIQEVGKLARQIEWLAPAMTDDGRRPDNCEYPWERVRGSGLYTVPADYDFPELTRLLRSPAGVFLLKMLPSAVEDLL
jgi:hypothetical protein